MEGLKYMSAIELMRLSVAIIDELLDREVVRTRDSPIGGYTEWLVSECFGLTLAGTGTAGYDATDDDGNRYQIKAARSEARTVRFSPFRKVGKPADFNFDYVIAVIFHNDYSVRLAVQMPRDVSLDLARRANSINGDQMRLQDTVKDRDGVTDVAGRLNDCLQPYRKPC